MNLITSQFRKQAAQQFKTRIDGGDDIYYVFIGRPNPFPNDEVPPAPSDNTQTVSVDVYEQMIAGKRIGVGDVNLMIPRYDWTAGTVYSIYSHDDPTIFEKQFFVVVSKGPNHSVFKCLDNNNNSPSTIAPDAFATSPEDIVYETADGYKWKFLFGIPDSVYKRFTTTSFIPVTPNANVTANSVSGSINHLQVTYQGSNYDSFGSGVIQIAAVNGNARVFQVEATKSANTNFFRNCAFKITSGTGAGQQRLISEYVVSGSTRNVVVDRPFDILPDTLSRYEISPAVIVGGDGNGFVGRALVNTASSNSIYKIEISNPGVDYTYATTTILANTSGVTNTAILKPMISPQGGHGFDVAAELGSRHLGISVTLNSADPDNNDKILDVNDFRVIGLIKDPQFANVVITTTPITSSFQVGDVITQLNSGATGTVVSINNDVIKLTNVNRYFVSGNSSVNTISSDDGAIAAVTQVSGPTTYIDQTFKLVVDNTTGQFQEDEVIVQGSNATGVLYTANSSQLRITNKRGVFNLSDDIIGIVETATGVSTGSTVKVTDTIAGDLVPQSGQVMYLETVRPISRYEQQSEILKLILKF